MAPWQLPPALHLCRNLAVLAVISALANPASAQDAVEHPSAEAEASIGAVPVKPVLEDALGPWLDTTWNGHGNRPFYSGPEARTRPGEIVYSREVSHRAIGSPNIRIEKDAVDAGPEGIVLGALGNSLKPLSDEQSALVSGSRPGATAAAAAPADTVLAATGAGDASALAASTSAASIVEGAVGGATAQIGAAMGTLGQVLGGGN